MMCGMFASVSTFWTSVGLPHRPTWAGIGRLQPGFAALAFQRLDHRGLFAADVRARAAMHRNVQVEAAAQDVLAQEAVLVGVGNGLDPALDAQEELAADVDEGALRADGIGRDDHAFQDRMRVALDDQAVLEGARLALVGVDGQVLDRRVLGDEAPLHAGGEAGAAAPAQARGLHLAMTSFGRHLQRLAQRLVAAVCQIGPDLLGVGPVDVGQQERVARQS